MAKPIESIKNRIQTALDINNMKPIELSGRTNISKSSISQYLSGYAKPSAERVYAIAKALNVEEAWILGYDVPMRDGVDSARDLSVFENIMPIKKKKIPLLGEIACGTPIYAEEDRESYIEIGTDINADFCLKAKGDSMTGARIMDGDIVFIKRTSEVIDGRIYAVVIEDEATLKRVYYDKEANTITLLAENPAYKPIVYTGTMLDQINILGNAVAFQSDVI